MRSRCRFLPVLSIAVFALVALPLAASAAPVIVTPVIAIVNNPANPNLAADFVSVAITGSGFGVPHIATRLKVRDNVTGGTRNYGSRDADHIVTWEGHRVVAKIPATFTNPQVWIEVGTANSAVVTADRYNYTYFDTNSSNWNSTPGNPFPLALAVDSPNVYLLEEFQSALKVFNGINGRVEKLAPALPTCPDDSCFATNLFNSDQPAAISELGEAVVVGDANRIWFLQGGGSSYAGVTPNHSRALAYNKATQALKVYNLPGNDNQAMGMAWDPVRHRLWYSSKKRSIGYGTAQSARLTSFDPDTIDPANLSVTSPSFNYATAAAGILCDGGSIASGAVGVCSNNINRGCYSPNDCVLMEKVCGPEVTDSTDDACFREHLINEVPLFSGVATIGQIMVASDGAVWYTSFFGTERPDLNPVDGFAEGLEQRVFIGRFDPATNEDRHFPLHHYAPPLDDPCRSDPEEFCDPNLGPWTIAEAANGDILISEYEEHAVARLDGSRIHDPACRTLTSPTTNCQFTGAPDSTCRNPCIETLSPPDYAAPGVIQLIHSLAEDTSGKVWFTQGGFVTNIRYASSVGFWKADRSALVMFPSPSLYVNGSTPQCPASANNLRGFSGADIAANPSNGDIWFSDFCSKRLGRLRRLN